MSCKKSFFNLSPEMTISVTNDERQQKDKKGARDGL